MRSIRLSLAVYFLALLAVALGAVSVLAYRNTATALDSNEEIRRRMLGAQYEKERKAEAGKVDRALFFQGDAFLGAAQYSYRMHMRPHQLIAPFGALNIAISPAGFLTAPVWVAGAAGPLSEHLFRDFIAEFHYKDDGTAVHPPEGQPAQSTEYFQINFQGGGIWKSASLGDKSLSFDRTAFRRLDFYKPQTEDIQLSSGVRVRRTMMKSTLMRFRPGLPRPGMGPARDNTRRSSAFGPYPLERQAPAVLLQWAADTSHRDARLAELQSNLDADLLNLKAESHATLSSLRNRLLLINLATFATVIVGGFWLVRLGLSPLQRLSEAVSLVSVRDFRLPFDEPKLPAELRPIVQRLTETLALLQRAFAREKQAAADISHELRTPLAALLTTIEVALRKPRSPEEYREVLSDCHATGQQMNQLVERLLALARMDAGVDTMRPRAVEVTNLAEQCASLVRPLAEARGLTLQVHRNGPIQMNADADKLREVINNLLHNAIEYNQPNGAVDLTVERQNGTLQLEVRDTGIGIAPDAREHIFERFYREDPSRQADGMHAGLGLAIVKGYVVLMGGTISVQSTQGKGSTFRLELPIQPSATGPVEHTR
jgi:two-component system, OmpR family, heavy metal sensor histidine kinase CusS